MARKTQIGESNGHHPGDFAQGSAELLHDVIELSELQASLFKADAEEAVKRLILPLAMMGLGAVVLLSTLPALILALGYLLGEQVEFFSTSGALAATSGAIVLVFGLVAAISAWVLTRRLTVFKRSIDELSRNLRWIKAVLRHGGGAAPASVPSDSYSRN